MIIDKPLPSAWTSRRLKYLATHNDEVLSESTEDDVEIDYVEISGVSLMGGIEEIDRMPFHKAPSRARRKVRPGDILVSTVRTYLRAIATVGADASEDLIASTGFCVVRPCEGMDSGYLGWVAKSEPFVGEVVARSVGVSYPAINASDLVDMGIPVPPPVVQQRIARFLDEKTARIDALIEKKQALLERLAEKRQALITRAVTKGLNPDVPMKPSGVDWLGDVPAHWSVAALGYRYEVQLGRMLNAERADGENLRPYLRVFDVQWGTINIADLPLMDFPADAQRRYRLNAGDLLVNEGGSFVGRSAIWRGELDECYYQKALHRLRPLDPAQDTTEFLYFLMEAATKNLVFEGSGNQTTIDHLTAEQLKCYRFGFPPLREQIEIGSQLADRVRTYENVESMVERAAARLNEYRSALITAAVTGQLAELNG